MQSGQCLAVSHTAIEAPARVEEPVSPVRQSSNGGAHEQSTLSQDAISQHEKVGCQNWQ